MKNKISLIKLLCKDRTSWNNSLLLLKSQEDLLSTKNKDKLTPNLININNSSSSSNPLLISNLKLPPLSERVKRLSSLPTRITSNPPTPSGPPPPRLTLNAPQEQACSYNSSNSKSHPTLKAWMPLPWLRSHTVYVLHPSMWSRALAVVVVTGEIGAVQPLLGRRMRHLLRERRIRLATSLVVHRSWAEKIQVRRFNL